MPCNLHYSLKKYGTIAAISLVIVGGIAWYYLPSKNSLPTSSRQSKTCGYFDESFSDISAAYQSIMTHKDTNKTFAFEVVKQTDNLLKWCITNVQPYHALEQETSDAFCNIIKGKAPARMIFADDTYIGIFPLRGSPPEYTRIMIAPRVHKVSVTDVTEDELRDILKKGVEVTAELGSSHAWELKINRGSPLQGVPHLHVHVIAYHQPLHHAIFDLVEKKTWNGKNFNHISSLATQAK